MIIKCAGDLLLAADFTGSGMFSPAGVMAQPSLALKAVLSEISERPGSEARTVLVHALATKIAGRCAIDSAEAERAIGDAMTARIAMEWRITIPAVGFLQALFLVTRLEKAEQAALFDLVLQLAGKPSFNALELEAS